MKKLKTVIGLHVVRDPVLKKELDDNLMGMPFMQQAS